MCLIARSFILPDVYFEELIKVKQDQGVVC